MNYLKFSVVTGGLIAMMVGLSGAAMANSDEEQLARYRADVSESSLGRLREMLDREYVLLDHVRRLYTA